MLVYSILAIIFGFAIGQALHSIAVDIEKGIYSFMLSYYNLLAELKYFYSYIISTYKNSFLGDGGENNVIKGAEIPTIKLVTSTVALISLTILAAYSIITFDRYLLLGFFIGTATSAALDSERFRGWFRHVLVPHRQIFEKELRKDDSLTKYYKSRHHIIFDDSGESEDSCDDSLMYMLTISHLENIGATRSRQFQATFSFCRSIWVILLIYSSIYITLSIGLLGNVIGLVYIIYPSANSISYSPLILDWTSQEGVFMISLIMLGFSLWFMEGERQYKSLFVHYVMVDFLTTTNKKIGIQNIDDESDGGESNE